MAESNKTTVIDLSDNPKNAALFFDYIIPIFGGIKDEQDLSFLHKLLPTDFVINFDKKMVESPKMIMNFGTFNGLNLSDKISHIVREKLYNSHQGGEYFVLYPHNNSISKKTYDCISLELAQLPIIDTTNAPWKQIIQIREDEKSISKLRNLKLFFSENYSDKEKNFVEDDLYKRLEDYENVTKDWGFETVTSSIQMLLTSPVTLTSVGSSLSIALFGEPLKALATAGTGAIIEIGKMSLHIAKEKKKLSVIQRDHPLAYIIDAKKKLEKE